MNSLPGIRFIVMIIAAVFLYGCRKAGSLDSHGGTESVITTGPLTVWTPCEGTLEARHVETILSRFQGRATLIEMIPEGLTVKRGDVLVRLDASQLETDLLRYRSEAAKAEADLDALEHATIPMEKQDLDVQLKDLQFQYDSEKQILVDTRELVDRKLISRREVEQQEFKLAGLAAKTAQLEQHRVLAEAHIHPAKLAQARAAADAAKQQLALTLQQLSNCVITAPADGITVYLPLHVGNEYRSLRVGDTLYPNQPFLCLPDLNEFILPCFIPESDLARVKAGMQALVTPLAFPDMRLEATVESVGTMAQPQPGYPAWQKYFRVLIRVDRRDERLRPGMSLHVEIRSHDQPNAVLIPRAAVSWEQAHPSCLVRTLTGSERRNLKLGWNDPCFHEVLEGVIPGDRVILP